METDRPDIWASIPTELLRAEIQRRFDDSNDRPQCGSGKTGHGYDLGLHVFALFLILAVSTGACAFPLLSRRLSQGGRSMKTVIFICQHFGTGVLMATAFVHLLPTAFTSLTDPCLHKFFNKGYRPLAGLIAMVSALVVVALEMYLTTRGAGHSHSHHILDDDDDVEESSRRGGYSQGNIQLHNMQGSSAGLLANASPRPESTPTHPPSGSTALLSATDEGRDSTDSLDRIQLSPHVSGHPVLRAQIANSHIASDPILPHAAEFKDVGSQSVIHDTTTENQRRKIIQCLLLEAGILFHSIFIGMALSVATGPSFVVFLIAIALHQSFEGLALGSRIADLQFPASATKPWFMVLAFGLTTPVGQAIGLFVHSIYDPMSESGLLMVGIMNAISSGLLLFAGLVQLLAQDFLSDKSYQTLRGTKRVHAYLAVVGGAVLMAAVGAFA